MWVVYILRCGDNSLYTGITNNLTERINKHNSGKGAKYTRARLPVSLEAFLECQGKSDAAKEEYRVKQLKRAQKLELIKCWLKSE